MRHNQRRVWRVRATAGVTAATLIVGCGGGSEHHQQPNGKTFAAKANNICQTANRHVRALTAPPATADGAARYIGELLPIVRTMTAKLAEQHPPASAKATFERYLTVLRSDVSELAGVRAAKTSDAKHLAAAASAIDARGGATDARTLGLTVCEQSPQPEGQ
jgi:hypothetical protein